MLYKYTFSTLIVFESSLKVQFGYESTQKLQEWGGKYLKTIKCKHNTYGSHVKISPTIVKCSTKS